MCFVQLRALNKQTFVGADVANKLGKWMEAIRVESLSSCSWGSQTVLSSSGSCSG